MRHQKRRHIRTWIAKNFIVASLAAAFVTSTPAQAAVDLTPGPRFEFGPEVFYYKYEEPGLIENEGLMYGAHGEFTYRFRENDEVASLGEVFSLGNTINAVALEGRGAFGQLDYTSSGTGSMDNIDNYLLEGRAKVLFEIPLAASVITPYFGVGVRYLNDDSSGMQTTTGHFGYERESQYFYVPVGVSWDQAVAETWTLGLSLEYDIFIDGEQTSHLEDVSSGLSTLENDQNKGFGVRGEIELVKAGERFDFSVAPFVQYWNIDASDVGVINCGGTPCALGYEPENETLEAGARLGVKF